MPTSLSNTLLSLELLCLLLSTSTYVLTSLSTFFIAAIKAFTKADGFEKRPSATVGSLLHQNSPKTL